MWEWYWPFAVSPLVESIRRLGDSQILAQEHARRLCLHCVAVLAFLLLEVVAWIKS